MSGKVLKVKDLMPVTFTPITDGDDKTKMVAKKVRYMCPITHDALTNTSRCAYLKTS
jgi:nitric oxide synthase-interacting protein